MSSEFHDRCLLSRNIVKMCIKKKSWLYSKMMLLIINNNTRHPERALVLRVWLFSFNTTTHNVLHKPTSFPAPPSFS